MTSDLDIYRAANVLVKHHGEDAPIHAAMNADAMLEKGDLDGCAVWKRILREPWRSYRGRRLSRVRRFTDRPLPTWHRMGLPKHRRAARRIALVGGRHLSRPGWRPQLLLSEYPVTLAPAFDGAFLVQNPLA